jgi:nucleoside-diphosphate-sugar epimerase
MGVKGARSDKIRDSASDDTLMITGSAGFLGRHLCKSLSHDGRVTVALYHHRLPESLPHIYPVCSDLSSAELLGAPLRGVSTVIHLAWEHNFVGTPTLQQDMASGQITSNLIILKNLITAMEQSGTRRLIFISAIGASRHSTNPFLREKYIAEFMVMNSRIPEKIVMRSALVCGGHDQFVKSIMNVMKVPKIYPVPRIKSKLAPLHVSDMVGIVRGLVTEKMVDSTALLEIEGSESYRVDDIFKMVSERYAKGSRLPIKGFIGATLVPFFERNSRTKTQGPRLRHFLALSSQADKGTWSDLHLLKVVPKKFAGFEGAMSDNYP